MRAAATRNADYGAPIEAGLFRDEGGKNYLDVQYSAAYIPRIYAKEFPRPVGVVG